MLMFYIDCMFLWEEAWNAHPYCLTVMTNGYFSIDKFKIAIESRYADDKGTTDNILNMPADELKKREIIFMDIAEKAPKDELPPDEVLAVISFNNRMLPSIIVKSVILVLLPLNGMNPWVGCFSYWMRNR